MFIEVELYKTTRHDNTETELVYINFDLVKYITSVNNTGSLIVFADGQARSSPTSPEVIAVSVMNAHVMVHCGSQFALREL